MLRRAQHERKFLRDFNPIPVRPEPVEGLPESFASSLLVENRFWARLYQEEEVR